MNDLEITTQKVRAYSRSMVRELDVIKGVYQDTGFTYSQCHILYELEQHKLLNLMELARIIQIDKSTVSRVVKTLIDRGLVRGIKNESDQRQKLFSLTDAGKEATLENNCLANTQVQSALNLLEPEEVNIIEKGLHLYAKALNQSRRQQDFKIRPVTPSDNQKIARLIRDVMGEFQAIGAGYSSMDPEVDQIFETYKDDRSVFYVIVRKGEILGCGGIGPLANGDPDTCELQKMYFRSELRGLGFGKKLLKICLRDAVNLGYQKCYLETLERMWQANLLYQKAGFQKLEKPLGDTGHCSCESYYVKGLTR